jgi:hypothetical protein
MINIAHHFGVVDLISFHLKGMGIENKSPQHHVNTM